MLCKLISLYPMGNCCYYHGLVTGWLLVGYVLWLTIILFMFNGWMIMFLLGGYFSRRLKIPGY